MNAPDLSALNTSTLAVFAALAAMSLLAVTVAFFKIFQFAAITCPEQFVVLLEYAASVMADVKRAVAKALLSTAC